MFCFCGCKTLNFLLVAAHQFDLNTDSDSWGTWDSRGTWDT